MHFSFRAFRALNDPQTCHLFKQEHNNVLKDYGITNVTTNNVDWMLRPNVYCVVAELLPEKRIVGGIRLEISEKGISLPVELAVQKLDPAIKEVVNAARPEGVAEVCALWNSKLVAGMGLSLLLIRACVSISSGLKIKKLLCICADYTLEMFQSVGFSIDHQLGDRGEFAYPNKMYTARVLKIEDTDQLLSAENYQKVRIDSLRANPLQTFNEQGIVEIIKCDYNLVIIDFK